MLLIEGMNHILKRVSDDLQEQINSYRNPDLPVMPELVEAIVDYIMALER